MANNNTKHARNKGYSDQKRMAQDDSKNPSMKNYGVKTGKVVNSSLERRKSGKSPWVGALKAKRIYDSK